VASHILIEKVIPGIQDADSMMKIRCADPGAFTAEVPLKRGSTIADLKSVLESEFKFDAQPCSVFTCGREWKDTEIIRQKREDPRLFVFVNRDRYYEKSYPTVEGAFRFPNTRFGKAPARGPADDPPIDPADFPMEPPPERVIRRRQRADPPPEEPPSDPTFESEIAGVTIRLTAPEEAAVRRLIEVAGDFQTALQVFVACDRDETFARE
jgi:hypothetical protein